MKKSKFSNLLILPLLVIAGFLGIMLSNTNDVIAANNEICGAEEFRDNYLSKIDVKYNENNITITNNSGLNLTYTFYADGNTDSGFSGDFNNGVSATFVASSGGYVEFTLKEEMTDPCESDAGTNIGSMELNVDGLINNPVYNNAVCINYRNKWSGNTTMENAVPYCFSQKTYEVYSSDVVQGWINTAEDLYESINSNNGGNDIVIDESYKEVSDVKNTERLVCDAFSTNNYETMHKYYHVETETSNNCKVTCKEEIEVNFSDPVATQAGMCFQYLIEIKSKAVCDSQYTAAPPTRKSVCYPSPVCINGGKGFDAGGPSEDFDDCILDCDDGKYTQSCIDRCYNKVYGNEKETKNKKITHNDIKNLSPLYLANESFYEVVKLANACPGTGDANALYTYMQNNPNGYYSGGSWHSSLSGICSLGPYYFRSLDQTRKTINMWNGDYAYSKNTKYYRANGNGILSAVHKDNTWCSDSCYWSGSCGSNTVLTEAIAQKEYEEEVEKYLSEKRACEQKAATCTNESTKYEIVVDNKDNDNDDRDDKEKFSSTQKLNNNKVSGDFPSMVTLIDGKCEDGEDDPWHYHNIITFPGAWVNNKTGKVVHSMDPGYEDFYTYIGNQYCTKLNSIPVNTAWYNWKVNQDGDSSVLTESDKNKIEESIKMNINGHIDNYGYFGWNFDVGCFYALDDPDNEECPPTDPNYPICNEDPEEPDNPGDPDDPSDPTPVNDYEFRPIALDNMFPSISGKTREIGFNWTCGATNLENEDYIIQPVSVMNKIQALGDSIYNGDEYLDYHIKLTPETMKKVKNYNDKYDNYLAPTSNNGSEVLTAGTNKTAGITVYRSYLLHKILNSSELLRSGVIGCNNEDNGNCITGSAAIDTSTSCYNEYVAQSSILKGAE